MCEQEGNKRHTKQKKVYHQGISGAFSLLKEKVSGRAFI